MNIHEIEFTLENIKLVKDEWPPLVSEIFGVIGAEKGIALVNKYSGLRLPLTKGLRNSLDSRQKRQELVEVIGEAAADKLINSVFRYCGTAFLIMPTCLLARKKIRNHFIIKDYDEMTGNGLSDIKAINELCKKYRVCIRQIRYILKGN